MTSVNASVWAQKIDGNSVRISELERIVFQSHPEVLAAIDADKLHAASEQTKRPANATTWLWVLLGLVVVFAPITGVAIYGSHRYLDIEPLEAATSIPIAGLCFAITLVAQVVVTAIWISQGALRSRPVLIYAVVTAVLAAFATAGVPRVADEAAIDAGFWYWPIPATVATGLLLASAVLLRWRAHGTVSPRAAGYKLVRQTIGALPADVRRQLRKDRDAAVRHLHERGLLNDSRAQVAAGAELGRLHRLELIWEEKDERDQG